MDNTYKLRPLYLLKLLYELTDADHPLTTNEILRLLDERFSVKTYRARIAEDIDALTDFGFEIGVSKGKNTSYYLEQRRFEPAELKILIDAVQSSLCAPEAKQ